jgi:hypothetical protein
MITLSNTSPLRYLIEIEKVDILEPHGSTYSERSTVIGSTREARYAGRQPAETPTTIIAMIPATIANGS